MGNMWIDEVSMQALAPELLLSEIPATVKSVHPVPPHFVQMKEKKS